MEQHTGLTTSGKTGGTSGYQAKELLEEDPATPATDVYAFGGLILAVCPIQYTVNLLLNTFLGPGDERKTTILEQEAKRNNYRGFPG